MAVAFNRFAVLRGRSKREHKQMGLTMISAFPVAISPLLRCGSSIDSAVRFALSSSSIKLPSILATLSGAVMVRRPGKVVSATGRKPPERARPGNSCCGGFHGAVEDERVRLSRHEGSTRRKEA